MALELDSVKEDQGAAYLMLTKVPSVRGEELPEAELTDIYALRKLDVGEVDESDEDIVQYEQIGYLMYLSPIAAMASDGADKGNKSGPPGNNTADSARTTNAGTLLSFQEGREGDSFEDVRTRIQNPADKIYRRGVSYLLTQLIQASTESASGVDYYLESVVERLDEALWTDPENLSLVQICRRIKTECDLLRDVLVPFADTLTEIVRGTSFPPEIVGPNRAAWSSIGASSLRPLAFFLLSPPSAPYISHLPRHPSPPLPLSPVTPSPRHPLTPLAPLTPFR